MALFKIEKWIKSDYLNDAENRNKKQKKDKNYRLQNTNRIIE